VTISYQAGAGEPNVQVFEERIGEEPRPEININNVNNIHMNMNQDPFRMFEGMMGRNVFRFDLGE